MKVSEIFRSIQGEGLNQGRPAVFVRLFGCNLQCSWCDTGYARGGDVYEEMSATRISGKVKELVWPERVTLVCVTGGEPLQQMSEVKDLMMCLLRHTKVDIDIETNGSIALAGLRQVIGKAENRVRLIVDHKMPSSGMNGFMNASNFEVGMLGVGDEIKFVVQTGEDVECLEDVLKVCSFGWTNVRVSPVWGSSEAFLQLVWNKVIEFETKLSVGNVRFGMQLHKQVWGQERSR